MNPDLEYTTDWQNDLANNLPSDIQPTAMTTTTDTDEHSSRITKKFRVWETDTSRMRMPPSHGYVISGAGGLLHHESLAHPLDYPVMFSTGLTDDEGTEIYSGDIVEMVVLKEAGASPTYGTEVGVIKFTDGCFRWQSEHGGVYTFDESTEMYVVGNVHENPELIPD